MSTQTEVISREKQEGGRGGSPTSGVIDFRIMSPLYYIVHSELKRVLSHLSKCRGEVWPRCEDVVSLIGELHQVVKDTAMEDTHTSHFVESQGGCGELAKSSHIILCLGTGRSCKVLSSNERRIVASKAHDSPAVTLTSTDFPEFFTASLMLDDWLETGAS